MKKNIIQLSKEYPKLVKEATDTYVDMIAFKYGIFGVTIVYLSSKLFRIMIKPDMILASILLIVVASIVSDYVLWYLLLYSVVMAISKSAYDSVSKYVIKYVLAKCREETEKEKPNGE